MDFSNCAVPDTDGSVFQALHLPSESELMKADCAEWGLTKGEGRGGRAAKVCVRYHHKHARLHAALVRYRLLLNDPLVRTAS